MMIAAGKTWCRGLMRRVNQEQLTMSERIDPINLCDLEERARAVLPQMSYDFYASGANDEITLRENEQPSSESRCFRAC
jgi:hypothetical protein